MGKGKKKMVSFLGEFTVDRKNKGFTRGVIALRGTMKFYSPGEQIARALNDQLNDAKHIKQVKHIDPASDKREPEKLSVLELKRFKARRYLSKYKKHLSYFKKSRHSYGQQSRPMTEAQCDAVIAAGIALDQKQTGEEDE